MKRVQPAESLQVVHKSKKRRTVRQEHLTTHSAENRRTWEGIAEHQIYTAEPIADNGVLSRASDDHSNVSKKVLLSYPEKDSNCNLIYQVRNHSVAMEIVAADERKQRTLCDCKNCGSESKTNDNEAMTGDEVHSPIKPIVNRNLITPSPKPTTKHCNPQRKKRSCTTELKRLLEAWPQQTTAREKTSSASTLEKTQTAALPSLDWTRLVDDYSAFVSRGEAEPVHFGSTLKSAKKAVERKLKEISDQNKKILNGPLVEEEERIFKRSQKSFAIYAEQERLMRNEEDAKDALTRRIVSYNNRNRKKTQGEMTEQKLVRQRVHFARGPCSTKLPCSCEFCRMQRGELDTLSSVTLMPFCRRITPDLYLQESDAADDWKRWNRKAALQRRSENTVVLLSEMMHSFNFLQEWLKA